MNYLKNTNLSLYFLDNNLGKSYMVCDVIHCKIYKVSQTMFNLIINLENKITYDSFSLIFENDKTNCLDVFNQLVNMRVILDESEITKSFVPKNEWINNNWGETYDYFNYTYNYKFNNRSPSGNKLAQNIMNTYSLIEKDINRYKEYKNFQPLLVLKKPTISYSDITSDSLTDFQKIERILSFSFVKTKNAKVKWNGLPLILKTSPSGGGRNSTEGYFINLEYNDLKVGIYHICAENGNMCLVKNYDINHIKSCFKSLISRSKFTVKAIILTSVIFERNMYRYREARTYRTVHIDAGHLTQNIEILCEHEKIHSFIEYVPNTIELDSLLSNNSLKETVLTSIAIG